MPCDGQTRWSTAISAPTKFPERAKRSSIGTVASVGSPRSAPVRSRGAAQRDELDTAPPGFLEASRALAHGAGDGDGPRRARELEQRRHAGTVASSPAPSSGLIQMMDPF